MSQLPPLHPLTAEDRGPIVIVTAYVCIVETILFTIIKLISNKALKRKIDWDDGFLCIAVLLALAQSIITERSAINGVGRYGASLTQSQLEHYFKLAFTSNILSLIVQALAKSSVVVLIHRLSASHTTQRIHKVAHGVILAWLIFSIFALSFQCNLPQSWLYDPSRCAGQGAMWYPVLILNILTDAAISFMFAPTVWILHISKWQKFRIASLFAFRLLVCGLTIAQLATLVPALRATDTTRAMLVPTIFAQLVMNFSILTAAAPSLYRFLNELHSGPGFGGMVDRSHYELSELSSGGRRGKKSTGYGRKKSKGDEATFRPDINGKSYNATVHEQRTSSDVMSKSSEHGSEDMIIKQTTAWTVKTYDQEADGAIPPSRIKEHGH
ncbi:hypothetical protein H2198_006665 [Neophaeococcomyces mojaviensis]|uniref:Uncharacterized protein n=1 Tax=Neophaeococcomyces mojaviensis TaxID=3383035 RepID=A0ACC3A270_9EURO|nr:hypothetical protein H2198_006665 [Knufia sp. JES_112]